MLKSSGCGCVCVSGARRHGRGEIAYKTSFCMLFPPLPSGVLRGPGGNSIHNQFLYAISPPPSGRGASVSSAGHSSAASEQWGSRGSNEGKQATFNIRIQFQHSNRLQHFNISTFQDFNISQVEAEIPKVDCTK